MQREGEMCCKRVYDSRKIVRYCEKVINEAIMINFTYLNHTLNV